MKVNKRSCWLLAFILLSVLSGSLGTRDYCQSRRRLSKSVPEPAPVFHRASTVSIGDPTRSPENRGESLTLEPRLGLDENIQRHKRPEQAPPWTVAFGKEFWRRPTTQTRVNEALGKSPVQVSSAVGVGEVIERVSHAFASDDPADPPVVHAKTYTASMNASGLRFLANNPIETAIGAKTETVFRTISVQQGRRALYTANASGLNWSVLGNTVQALLDPASGLVEHYEARGEGVAVTWVFSKPLATTGPFVVEAELSGLKYAGQTEGGLHFTDETGTARVRVGKVTAVDSAQNRWDVPVRADQNRLRIEVRSEEHTSELQSPCNLVCRL